VDECNVPSMKYGWLYTKHPYNQTQS